MNPQPLEQPTEAQPVAETPKPRQPRRRRVYRVVRPPQPGEVVKMHTATYRVGPKGNWIRQS